VTSQGRQLPRKLWHVLIREKPERSRPGWVRACIAFVCVALAAVYEFNGWYWFKGCGGSCSADALNVYGGILVVMGALTVLCVVLRRTALATWFAVPALFVFLKAFGLAVSSLS
jgi:hypothetical protein